MARTIHLIPASSQFWTQVAKQFLALQKQNEMPIDLFAAAAANSNRDFSHLRVIVPTFEHAHLLTRALSAEIGGHFIPPKIQTMFDWLGMQIPLPASISANSERLMSLYAELRQHAWLKTLFGARRNTDLLPLAQTLLTLSDELTQVWLPQAVGEGNTHQLEPQKMQATWHEALAQLALPLQKIVSDETQLVWTLWQSQLDQHDKTVQEFQQMMRLAATASMELFWVAPTMPNAIEHAFLQAYERTQPVHIFGIDWRSEALPHAMRKAWSTLPEALAESKITLQAPAFDWSRLHLCEVSSLEEEAEQAAQCIIEWLQAGKQKIAVIAQDRVISRRLRALLERAQIYVADETGWKLSTTRAAACLSAWFEMVATRADTMALLDFLKSPFLPVLTLNSLMAEVTDSDDIPDKAELVMEIELALRRNNVVGGWDAVLSILERLPQARIWIAQISRLAHSYGSSASASRRSLKEWTQISIQTLTELGMLTALQDDRAGAQLVQMLQALGTDCHALDMHFSFSEWRAFINLQMESTPFKQEQIDQRVLMLPLNGARLRSFDAVYLIGGDAKHLPSKPQETLFFTNAVRRECGLVTREERQLQQLRDFAEVILSNNEVVLSWQSQINGELNALSPWIEQVKLYLARQDHAALASTKRAMTMHQLSVERLVQPRPAAAELMPATLSASGLSSLIACPYQFFAGRMLKLSAIDELSDMPEKRDYGDWLHAILKTYHDRLLSDQLSLTADRIGLLHTISDTWFARVLKHSPAALGYSMRWRKVIPAYVAWANQREADGWQFAFGEVWAEAQLAWDDGGITLRGRIDRIDERQLESGEVERAVLDYKTKNRTSLKARLKNFEDHQLAFYGLLQAKIEHADSDLGEHLDKHASEHNSPIIQILEPVDTANYVALEIEREKTGDVEAEDYSRWKNELELAIRKNMQAIQHGAGLPAQGVESVCQYCEVRGLCRKGAW
ncbi:PD-(D/E)XK nuclease family protein [Undibacterium flavidum]|uniref:PD-(D/E)XK nuclease family protein n=1 Tax=Undibacterium flavidum TaxID=2762297 RepID=A0ABR6YD08_9BURK|nr:PD-(D/E)XK nuclease family protein [Undibacterium flavidum]MBC3874441.1 PD-(D/E)XK nuclease family protein [Undibacterium flavidum]